MQPYLLISYILITLYYLNFIPCDPVILVSYCLYPYILIPLLSHSLMSL